MKIKRFFAPDMRRALAQVRIEHGPDAVILSSATVDGGVEVVSALDYDGALVKELASGGPPPAAEPQAMASQAAHAMASQAAQAAPVMTAPAIEWSQDPALRAMRNDLEAMKKMLQEQFAHLAWADLKTFQPERALFQRRVAALGFESRLADALAGEAYVAGDPAGSWRKLVLGLADRLRVADTDPMEQGGVIALVGPTGVGKTTTLAKLAARQCLAHGADSMALISTDNFRVGAQRQLEAFGAILGVPVRRADSADALARLLREQQGRRLILIDTAGLAPRDERVGEPLHSFVELPQVQRYLVLPANMQAAAMAASVEAFGRAPLAGIALTKLDETGGLGAALSVLADTAALAGTEVPVTWLGTGQRVPEDLKLARLADLVGWAAKPPPDEAAPVQAPARPRAARSGEIAHAAA